MKKEEEKKGEKGESTLDVIARQLIDMFLGSVMNKAVEGLSTQTFTSIKRFGLDKIFSIMAIAFEKKFSRAPLMIKKLVSESSAEFFQAVERRGKETTENQSNQVSLIDFLISSELSKQFNLLKLYVSLIQGKTEKEIEVINSFLSQDELRAGKFLARSKKEKKQILSQFVLEQKKEEKRVSFQQKLRDFKGEIKKLDEDRKVFYKEIIKPVESFPVFQDIHQRMCQEMERMCQKMERENGPRATRMREKLEKIKSQKGGEA